MTSGLDGPVGTPYRHRPGRWRTHHHTLEDGLSADCQSRVDALARIRFGSRRWSRHSSVAVSVSAFFLVKVSEP